MPLKIIRHTHRHITAGGADATAVGAIASVGEVLEGGSAIYGSNSTLWFFDTSNVSVHTGKALSCAFSDKTAERPAANRIFFGFIVSKGMFPKWFFLSLY